MTPTPHAPDSSGFADSGGHARPVNRSRRQFLTLAGLGAAGVAGALVAPTLRDVLLAEHSTSGNFGPSPGGRTTYSGAPDPGLILVSIQLGGGLDFLNTVVPVDDGTYADLRGVGALTGDERGDDAPELIAIGDGLALNSMPHLAEQWNDGNLAIVHGVGSEGSSLSHFDATDMWEKGSPDFGTTSGWLGRALADLAGADADPLLAVSLGGVSPTMYAQGWSPVGLRPESRIPWSSTFREEYAALDQALSGEVSGGRDLMSQARDSQLALRGIGARLAPIVGDPEDREDDYDGDEDLAAYLGLQLDLVADMIGGGLPTRAYHVAHDGFDTHATQREDLPLLLGELDAAIGRFQRRLGPDADRVVVATWTEFGRRPEWNGEGTEHGTAGVQFVVGPTVKGGHHGEPPPLDRFDRDDNFLITTDFRDYISGLTLGSLGVDPALVVDGGRGPLDLLEVR
ncbi:MAG: DUF1501 domain-containing protein [Actinomycetota bacterium]